MVENQRVITKVYFPRLILPFSAAFSGLVDFAIGFIVLLIFTFAHGIKPTLTILLLPFFLLLAILTVLGVGLWLSALNALYRDVRYLIPFIIQFWTLASPVYYSSSMVPERYRWLYGLNPMAGVIDGFRWSLTGTGHAPAATLYASVAMVCAVLFGGLIFFNRMKEASPTGYESHFSSQGRELSGRAYSTWRITLPRNFTVARYGSAVGAQQRPVDSCEL